MLDGLRGRSVWLSVVGACLVIVLLGDDPAERIFATLLGVGFLLFGSRLEHGWLGIFGWKR